MGVIDLSEKENVLKLSYHITDCLGNAIGDWRLVMSFWCTTLDIQKCVKTQHLLIQTILQKETVARISAIAL